MTQGRKKDKTKTTLTRQRRRIPKRWRRGEKEAEVDGGGWSKKPKVETDKKRNKRGEKAQRLGDKGSGGKGASGGG